MFERTVVAFAVFSLIIDCYCFHVFSVEEAKTKMYACSTTTYKGFQAVMTEEESQKFEGKPLGAINVFATNSMW